MIFNVLEVDSLNHTNASPVITILGKASLPLIHQRIASRRKSMLASDKSVYELYCRDAVGHSSNVRGRWGRDRTE